MKQLKSNHRILLILIGVLLSCLSSVSFGQLKVLSDGSLQEGQSEGRIKLQTDDAYMIIGGVNSSHNHFYTNTSEGFGLIRTFGAEMVNFTRINLV